MLVSLKRQGYNASEKDSPNKGNIPKTYFTDTVTRVDLYDSIVVMHDEDGEDYIAMNDKARQEISEKCFLLQKGLKIASGPGTTNATFGKDNVKVTYHKVVPNVVKS
tara:strand:- start:138 stop:458 length:321 start_codon:yes stop_codon:yes gene_type:complete